MAKVFLTMYQRGEISPNLCHTVCEQKLCDEKPSLVTILFRYRIGSSAPTVKNETKCQYDNFQALVHVTSSVPQHASVPYHANTFLFDSVRTLLKHLLATFIRCITEKLNFLPMIYFVKETLDNRSWVRFPLLKNI